MKRFEGKVAIITGGASGLGAATAESMLREGAKVVIADINAKGAAAFVRKLRENGYEHIQFIKTDVTIEAEVRDLVNDTVKAFGRVDILFANAGGSFDGALADITKEAWDRTIALNLTGVFLCDKYVIEQMLRQGHGGSIVNTGSIHSVVGQDDMTAYAASKGGVQMLSKTVAMNYAAKDIRINTIMPGYIDTPLLDKISAERRLVIEGLHPMKRLGTPQEVANVVMFLASDEASFVTGASVAVDGGYLSR